MPYTTLVGGTTILASWANASVRDQSVTPFASAAARTSAITSPVDGMVSALTDSDSLWYYNGAAWVTPNTLYVRKTANESVTSSTTLQDDDQLILPLAANRTYEIRGMIIYDDGTSDGRLKTGWSGPAAATFDWLNDGLINTDFTQSAASVWRIANTISDSRETGAGPTGEVNMLLINGLAITAGTAGNLTFRWAQMQSNAVATTVRTGSWLIGQVIA